MQNTIKLEFVNGRVTLQTKDALLNEIVAELSNKLGLKIQIRGEEPGEKISCNINKPAIETILSELLYDWNYVMLSNDKDRSIDIWLISKKENHQIYEHDTTDAIEDIDVPTYAPRPGEGKGKRLFGIFRTRKR